MIIGIGEKTMLEHFYLNYYSLASIMALWQWVACAIFFFSLSNKTKGANLLFYISLVSSVFALGFTLSQTTYYPSAIPRMLSISVMVLSNVLHTQFILHFPEVKHPRFAKILFIIEMTITIALILYLFLLWSNSPGLVYDFEAHYYEMQIPDYLKLAGIVMVLIVFLFTAICLWYAIISKGVLRKAYLLMLLAQVGISIIPIPLSLMNRMGIISREVFMSYYCVIATIGFFIFLMVFINNTNDKTSFIVKIISVSFLTFILLFNLISNLVIKDRDKVYDQLHLNELNSILYTDERPKDLRYIIEYKPEVDQVKFIYKDFSEELPIQSFKTETNNAYLIKSLETQSLTPSELKEYLQTIKIKENENAKGYINLILSYLDTLSPDDKSSTKKVLEYIRSRETFLFYRYNKVKGFADKDFRVKLVDFLNKEKEDFSPFKLAIESHLQTTTKEGVELKKEILEFLIKMKNVEDRKFREASDTKEAFIAFHFIGKENGVIYEIGFSYLEYRKFIHEQAVKLFYALVLAMVLILFGTPIFLSGALVSPLNDLLAGLRKVRAGDLNITVPIKVQDEIGYLAGSFNTMVKSIKESKEKLQEYSEHLEQMVEERTAELQSTLNTVNVLKSQQDGDYFLTSLLLKPFIVNHGKSDKVKLEFLISQKKKFEFHGKKYEIGGDLCHTQNLELNGKNYILFFNCDSMGKSLQGAGGAIVFGSVFFSIIERTNQSIHMKDQSPERWIKNAFIELHKVFLTFDGSMLVSSVIGLMDEDTGLLYYINAEHPWTVLYRDGRSDFIENENYFSKLGSPINARRVFVNLYQMKKGDVLFIGSDGRDDFEFKEKLEHLPTDRNINYDEREFLKTVIQAEGDLQKIYEITTEKGTITDDYSLIRIEYEGEDFDGKAIKNLAIKNYNAKNYKDALKYGLDYFNQNPSDTEFLFVISHIFKLEKKFEKAAYFAERVRIRNPNHFKNLTNLVQIQIELGAFSRAEEILKECEILDSTSPKLSKLRDLLRLNKELAMDNTKIE